MCRLAAYFGHEDVLLDELLLKPKNSLIKQSREAKEGRNRINADGFGMAWYDFDIDAIPASFKSIQPAWNDSNLRYLSQKIKSSCFLAHVRASTVGDVNQNNCHPFTYNEYAFIHNGTIRNFDHYKKKIINEIDEALFLKIKGNTDSEYLFFLIINFIEQGNSMDMAVKKAIAWVVSAQEKNAEFSRINIVLTNGKEIIATKFVSKKQKALSLRYCTRFDSGNHLDSLILSSEPLDDDAGSSWEDLPENSYLHLIKKNMQLHIHALH